MGIDDDPLLRQLTRIPISSVAQGTRRMGKIAAGMLHRKLTGAPVKPLHVLVPPEGINAQDSSRHQPVNHPYVMRALHYIRQFAAQGAKVSQVADYVGVSRTTLETHFHRQRGKSVHDEILAFKLHLACGMLSGGELSCAEIAERCGINQASHFINLFKSREHITPLQFRKSWKP